MFNSKPKTSRGFTLALSGILCLVHGGINVAYYVTASAAAAQEG
jgi:hypothetical protein